MDGVARQVRIGNVALDATHRELAAEGAAPAVLDHVAGALYGRGLAHDAKIEPFAARPERLDYHLGAVHRRAFLIAGE